MHDFAFDSCNMTSELATNLFQVIVKFSGKSHVSFQTGVFTYRSRHELKMISGASKMKLNRLQRTESTVLLVIPLHTCMQGAAAGSAEPQKKLSPSRLPSPTQNIRMFTQDRTKAVAAPMQTTT